MKTSYVTPAVAVEIFLVDVLTVSDPMNDLDVIAPDISWGTDEGGFNV